MLGAIFVFGGIGFLIGGPIGALIGIALVFFAFVDDKRNKYKNESSNEKTQELKKTGEETSVKFRLPEAKSRPLPPGTVCFSWHDHNIIKYIFQQQSIIDNYSLRPQVADVFVGHNINCLYHITDKKNYEDIRKAGCLLSRRVLNRGKFSYVSGGGRLSKGLDNKLGLDSYVHLCFNPYLPMFWKMLYEQNRELIVFKINPAIATMNTVLFSDRNSVDSTAINATYDEGGLDNLNFNDIFSRHYYGESMELFKHRQAEILIPNVIPKEFIINFDNPQLLDTYTFDGRYIGKPDFYCPFANQKHAIAFDDAHLISIPRELDTEKARKSNNEENQSDTVTLEENLKNNTAGVEIKSSSSVLINTVSALANLAQAGNVASQKLLEEQQRNLEAWRAESKQRAAEHAIAAYRALDESKKRLQEAMKANPELAKLLPETLKYLEISDPNTDTTPKA